MFGKTLCVLSAAALCLAVPAAVWAVRQNDGRALDCSGGVNPVCGLYRICRSILAQYPEAEITEQGKDCSLTVESRQIIIRRKRTEDGTGYFFYSRSLPRKVPVHP